MNTTFSVEGRPMNLPLVVKDGWNIYNDLNTLAALIVAGGLPSQTGHAGQYLTTNGTTASWAAVGGSQNLASVLAVATAGDANNLNVFNLAKLTIGAATLQTQQLYAKGDALFTVANDYVNVLKIEQPGGAGTGMVLTLGDPSAPITAGQNIIKIDDVNYKISNITDVYEVAAATSSTFTGAELDLNTALVKFNSSGGATVAQIDANEMTLSGTGGLIVGTSSSPFATTLIDSKYTSSGVANVALGWYDVNIPNGATAAGAFVSQFNFDVAGAAGSSQSGGVGVIFTAHPTAVIGIITGVDITSSTQTGSTIQAFEGVAVDGFVNRATMDFYYGFYCGGLLAGTGTVTHQYGIYLENMDLGATDSYSLYANAGKFHIGGLQDFANNAAAITGGLVTGDLYYTNTAGEVTVKIVI